MGAQVNRVFTEMGRLLHRALSVFKCVRESVFFTLGRLKENVNNSGKVKQTAAVLFTQTGMCASMCENEKKINAFIL